MADRRATSSMTAERLFEAATIGPRQAPNRLVAQPMETGLGAPDGAVNDALVAHYQRLAAGGWGTIVVEATSVSATTRSRRSELRLSEDHLAGFERLVAAVREANPQALLLIQLTHGGAHGHPDFDPVSVLPTPAPGCRGLTGDEIEAIGREFVAAALLAERAGFDGIDLKQCHGYFGGELLRPANTRTDGWGGARKARGRFMTEVFQDLRSQLKRPDFLLGTRLSWYEKLPGGCGTAGPDSTAYDAAEAAYWLNLAAQLGLHFVNISGDRAEGPGVPSAMLEEMRVGSLWCERLAWSHIQADGLPLTVIGSGYSNLQGSAVSVAARRLGAGQADLVGFARQYLVDPDFPLRAREGKRSVPCRTCGACMELLLSGHATACIYVDPAAKEIWEHRNDPPQAEPIAVAAAPQPEAPAQPAAQPAGLAEQPAASPAQPEAPVARQEPQAPQNGQEAPPEARHKGLFGAWRKKREARRRDGKE